MADIKSYEGEVDFRVAAANKPCKTWYKVYGDLKASNRRPLVVCHGGPGGTHHYLKVLTELTAAHGIPVILYDQLGNGNSTILDEKNGDVSFWTPELFSDELQNLLDHLGIQDDFDLLGHSWGGMLGALFATKNPKGLHRLVISNSPASMPLWAEAAQGLVKTMPQDVQDGIFKNEAAGTYDSPEYKAALDSLYTKHFCTVQPMPDDMLESFGWLQKHPTVYGTMNGPSECTITGSLKSWTIVEDAHKIDVPTLSQDLTLISHPFVVALSNSARARHRALQQVRKHRAESSACRFSRR